MSISSSLNHTKEAPNCTTFRAEEQSQKWKSQCPKFRCKVYGSPLFWASFGTRSHRLKPVVSVKLWVWCSILLFTYFPCTQSPLFKFWNCTFNKEQIEKRRALREEKFHAWLNRPSYPTHSRPEVARITPFLTAPTPTTSSQKII